LIPNKILNLPIQRRITTIQITSFEKELGEHAASALGREESRSDSKKLL
jgi:hypothetical protein